MTIKKVQSHVIDVILVAEMTTFEMTTCNYDLVAIDCAFVRPTIGQLPIVLYAILARNVRKRISSQAHRILPGACCTGRAGVEPAATFRSSAFDLALNRATRRALERRDYSISRPPKPNVRDGIVWVRSKVVAVVRKSDLRRYRRQILRAARIMRKLVHKHTAIGAPRSVDSVQVNAVSVKKGLKDFYCLLNAVLARRPPAIISACSIAVIITVDIVRIEIACSVIFSSRVLTGVPRSGSRVWWPWIGGASAAFGASDSIP